MANVVERLVNGYVIRIEGQRPVYFEVADDITLADICPKPWPNEFAVKLEEIIPLDQMSCMVKEPYVAEPEQEGPKARVFFPDNGDTIEVLRARPWTKCWGRRMTSPARPLGRSPMRPILGYAESPRPRWRPSTPALQKRSGAAPRSTLL